MARKLFFTFFLFFNFLFEIYCQSKKENVLKEPIPYAHPTGFVYSNYSPEIIEYSETDDWLVFTIFDSTWTNPQDSKVKSRFIEKGKTFWVIGYNDFYLRVIPFDRSRLTDLKKRKIIIDKEKIIRINKKYAYTWWEVDQSTL
jgi:hypothetical protein